MPDIFMPDINKFSKDHLSNMYQLHFINFALVTTINLNAYIMLSIPKIT